MLTIGKTLTMAALAVLGGSVAAQASLLAYEPFDYSSGQIGGDHPNSSEPRNTGEQSGSTADSGFTGDWTPFPDAGNTPYATGGTSLSYGSLMTDGGQFKNVGGLDDGGAGFWNWGGAGRDLASSVTDTFNQDGNATYISYLQKGQGKQWNEVFLTEPGKYDPSADPSGTLHYNAGVRNWKSTDFQIGGAPTGIALDDQTHLWVLKVTWGQAGTADDDTVDLYFDPSLGSGEPGSPTVTATGQDLEAWKAISLESQNADSSDAQPVTVDELRIGTTYADVTPHTPVPEPASLVLLGLGGGLMMVRRRRGTPRA